MNRFSCRCTWCFLGRSFWCFSSSFRFEFWNLPPTLRILFLSKNRWREMSRLVFGSNLLSDINLAGFIPLEVTSAGFSGARVPRFPSQWVGVPWILYRINISPKLVWFPSHTMQITVYFECLMFLRWIVASERVKLLHTAQVQEMLVLVLVVQLLFR